MDDSDEKTFLLSALIQWIGDFSPTSSLTFSLRKLESLYGL